MKCAILSLLFSLHVIFSFSQVTIKGNINDGKQPLASISIDLLSKDSVILKSARTNETGEFIFYSVSPGNYRVTATGIGYAKYLSAPFTVNRMDYLLSPISMNNESRALNEVVVKATKPLLEQKIDRLSINVQNSIGTAGSSVLEVLQKAPGVTVNRQSNTISLQGRAGVRIMINDKMQEGSYDVLMQMLDGMSAANIEKIELINAPSAKYDAEGSGGIIHLVMKKNTELGTNGSFGLILGTRRAENLGGNFNLAHRTEKIAFFLDYSILKNHNRHLFSLDRQSVENGFDQRVTDESNRENITTQQNLNAGLEWKMNNRTLLSLAITGYRRNWEMNAVNTDSNSVSKDSSMITVMHIRETNIWQSGTAGLAIQHTLNSKTEIGLSLDYLYYQNNNPSGYDNRLFNKAGVPAGNQMIDLQKNTPIRFYVAKADCRYTWSSTLSFEGGVKAVTSDLNNNVLVRKLENNEWRTDSAFTSNSGLTEDILAIYASVKWQPGNLWQVNGGLRYENTHTILGTPDAKNLIDRQYGNFFPGLSVSKNFGKGRDMQFSYVRRITRPTYNDIAPFVFFWGPGTFSAGNTNLYPALVDAVRTGYHVKQWIVSLELSHSKNEISFFQPTKDSSSDNLIYRSENLDWLNMASLSNSFSFSLSPKWKIQYNLTMNYQSSRTAAQVKNVTGHQFSFTMNLVNSIQLPKDFSLEISGSYQSKTLSGVSILLPVGSLNAGIQKKFGKSGTLKLAGDDLLNTDYWRIKSYQPQNNLNSNFTYRFNNRFIRLTYTRSFGNNKLKAVNVKSGSEEERKRVSN